VRTNCAQLNSLRASLMASPAGILGLSSSSSRTPA
jgi:hypothetical protein